MDQVLSSESSQEVMQKHAASFSLASYFFNKENWHSATQLYHWCRYCDDAIDLNPNASDETLQELTKLTHELYHLNDLPAAFNALKEVSRRYEIPKYYMLELLQGMEMDVREVEYQTLEELELYCYRVASTVGLMMCHIMGISNEKALEHAKKLGMAMQITNICRDVKEDFERGRIYLPLNLINFPKDQLMDSIHRQELFQVVEKLLAKAEEYYAEGEDGLKYLSWRSSLVIKIALHLYRNIGRGILRKGPESLDSRFYVTKTKKILLVSKAIFWFVLSSPIRLFSPFRRKRIELICKAPRPDHASLNN